MFTLCWNLKDRGATGGGVDGSRIKFLSQLTGLCPMFKTPSIKPVKESDEEH
jgi:hypothetical protein